MEPIAKVMDIFPVYATFQEGFSLENIPDSFAYVIDSKGWKIFKRTAVAESIIAIDEVKGFDKCKETVSFLSSKLPVDLIRRVTAFFIAVYEKQKSEAVGYLYYKPDTKEWDFIPPAQTATGASAKYDQAPKKEGWLIAGTIHSHGNLSAFHSGTDHKDEEFFDGVHITIGRVNAVPEYACSLMAQGARCKFDYVDLIEDFVPSSEIPENWMEAIKLDAPKSIDDKKFGKKIEKLYNEYFSGRITETEYEEKLEALEDKIDEEDDKKDTGSTPVIWDSPASFGFIGSSMRRRNGRWGF